MKTEEYFIFDTIQFPAYAFREKAATGAGGANLQPFEWMFAFLLTEMENMQEVCF